MKFSIIGSLEKPGLREAVRLLVEKLTSSGAEYLIDRRIVQASGDDWGRTVDGHLRDFEGCITGGDMLVAFGGDGTILAAARAVGNRGTPILGVNLGKLGFLAEFGPEEIPKAITDILEKRYILEERLVLQAKSPMTANKVFHAVNDIVIDKSRSSHIIDVETHIDGAFAVTYRGDGVIVSTPTGSTAYALSNGGPIVIPTSRVIGITPISPHTLSGRPLIVPDGTVIRIRVPAGSEEILCSADGQTEALVHPPFEVVIQKAEYTVRLVKRVDRSYFDVLRAKLFWGQDARA